MFLAANATFPLARCSISEQELLLEVLLPFLNRKYHFPKEKIQSISIQRGLFSKGIRITHKIIGVPPLMVFWTISMATLVKNLSDLGYSVDTGEQSPD